MIKFKKGKLPENNEERLKYLYRFQEQLRIFHNTKGKQVKNGTLSMKKFREFQNGWFKNRMHLICNAINDCKANLTEEEKNTLLVNEKDVNIGTVKYKEEYKKDKNIIINIEDIEDN